MLVPTRPPARRGAVASLLVVGLAMMLVGVVMLGYVGWQFFGTNYVAHREQERVTRALQAAVGAGRRPAPAEARPRGQGLGADPDPEVRQDVRRAGARGRRRPTSWPRATATSPSSADPGEVGNYALAAHRVTHGEPLRADARAAARRRRDRGDRRRRRTSTSSTPTPTPWSSRSPACGCSTPCRRTPSPAASSPRSVPGQRLITLTTCSEIFHTDDRMIAFGHLVRHRDQGHQRSPGSLRPHGRPGPRPRRRHLLPADR